MPLFSLLLGFGAFTGLLLTGWRAPQKEATRYLDTGLGILAGALVGSRALAVAANWGYYQAHPGEIIQVWLGGLSGVGALAGSVLAIVIIALCLHMPVSNLADVFTPLAGTMATAAWLGCWVYGWSYGPQSAAWWALPARDEWSVMHNRIPVQLFGAILSLLLVWVLDRASKRFPQNGMLACLGLLGLSVEIFGLSFLRADPAQFIYGLRLEAWGALGLMIFSLLAVVILLLRWQHRKVRTQK